MTDLRLRRQGSSVQAAVPIPVSTDGTAGRKCPECRHYFKVDGQRLADASELWCPYCGAKGKRDSFLTFDQRRRLISAARQIALQEVTRMLDDAFQQVGRGTSSGLLQIRFERGHVEIPPLLTYLERRTVRSIDCSSCAGHAAVYGIAIFCPFCGVNDPFGAFTGSIEASRELMASIDQLPAEAVRRLQASGGAERLAEQCLVEAVGAFEAWSKRHYANLHGEDALTEVLRRRGRNAFQRLDAALEMLGLTRADDMSSVFTAGELRELRLVFATRHVLTHNGGVADNLYAIAGGSTAAGQRIQVTSTTANRALSLVERLVHALTRASTAPSSDHSG